MDDHEDSLCGARTQQGVGLRLTTNGTFAMTDHCAVIATVPVVVSRRPTRCCVGAALQATSWATTPCTSKVGVSWFAAAGPKQAGLLQLSHRSLVCLLVYVSALQVFALQGFAL